MRISRDQMFMEMAKAAAKRSTCHRMNVGAVVVENNNVISIGYNGPPSGEPHCQGNDCDLNADGGCKRSVHAEKNAIDRLTWSVFKDPRTLYITHSPCIECSSLILELPVKIAIIYENKYRDILPIHKLVMGGHRVSRITPSGYKIDERTNRVETID